jgi:hypothetical protein
MVKTRPANLRSPALTPPDKLPAPNPGAVGQVAPMGDATGTPRRGSQQMAEARYRQVIRPTDSAQPYSGEERRRTERRQNAHPTTLDTRMSGPERRRTGRISLKV